MGPQAPLLVLSVGLLFPLIAGEFDLSVGANVGIVAMVMATLNVNHGLDIWLDVLIAIAIGALIGIVNGFLVVKYDLNSFIVTLGMATVLEGLTLVVGNGETVTGVSIALINFTTGTALFGLPMEFYLGVIVSIAVLYYLEITVRGKELYFTGQGREVARLNGIAVDRIRLVSFVISGIISSLAGVLYLGTSGAATPTSGTELLLPAFAATFLGATAIHVGRFNVGGTFIAVYFLITGVTGLEILGMPLQVTDVFYGAALIVAVLGSRLLGRAAMKRGGVGDDVRVEKFGSQHLDDITVEERSEETTV